MITAEEFFRSKIKEHSPDREVVTLSQELITAEEGMRWAHEFKQLHLPNITDQSHQLRAFKQFLQSEYNLPVSNRMLDEFQQKQNP